MKALSPTRGRKTARLGLALVKRGAPGCLSLGPALFPQGAHTCPPPAGQLWAQRAQGLCSLRSGCCLRPRVWIPSTLTAQSSGSPGTTHPLGSHRPRPLQVAAYWAPGLPRTRDHSQGSQHLPCLPESEEARPASGESPPYPRQLDFRRSERSGRISKRLEGSSKGSPLGPRSLGGVSQSSLF